MANEYELPLGGMTTNEANILTKIPNALQAIRNGRAIYFGAGGDNSIGGAANAITLATHGLSTPPLAYNNGMRVSILPTATNTTGVTIDRDAIGVKAVVKRQAGALVALVAGDIVSSIPFSAEFNTIVDAWVMDNPATVSGAALTALGSTPSGAGTLPEANLPTTIAYEDEANTFTADQTISKVDPRII